MKKIISLLLIINLILMLSACNEDNTESFNDSSATTTSTLTETVSKTENENQTVSSEETVSSTESETVLSQQETVSQDDTSSSSENTPSNEPAESFTPSETVVTGNQSSESNTTFTGLPALPTTEYTVFDPTNTRGLSTEHKGFSFGIAKDGQPHSITVNNQATFDSYNSNALAWDNKSTEKVLYLTFDCGYPYGDLVPRILNTLDEKQVKAAFFVTMQYLKQAPNEAAEMINKGHIVGNHTVTHPVCTTITREELANELLGIDNYLRTNFGYETKYFRYPTGAYSEDTLDLVKSVGYRSIFWSIAHADWDPANQPGVEVSFETVTSRLHPGAVILLHSTSPDNVEILGRFIDHARNEGYVFKTLDEYGFWESNN